MVYKSNMVVVMMSFNVCKKECMITNDLELFSTDLIYW